METALAAVVVVGTILGLAVIFWVQRELKKTENQPLKDTFEIFLPFAEKG